MSDTEVVTSKQSGFRSVIEFLVKYQAVVVPIAALLAAFFLGGILIAFQGVNPLLAYKTLFTAAFGDSYNLHQTFLRTTPLILVGLAVAIALKVGLFNIGAQGQLMFGALASAIVGYSFVNLPTVALVPLCIVVGAIGGALWAAISGALKAYRGVHEVISTIMLNSIAYGIIAYLIAGPLKQPNQVLLRTKEISENAMLGDLGFLPAGFLVALLFAFLLSWLVKRTVLGYKFTTVGQNKNAAIYAGIRIPRMIVLSMLFSGGLAGIGGAVQTMSFVHRYQSGFNDGLGFDGITIALLARGNALGTIPAALLVGALRAGASSLQFEYGIAQEVVDMILAISLMLVSIPVLANLIFGKRAQRLETLTSGWGA